MISMKLLSVIKRPRRRRLLIAGVLVVIFAAAATIGVWRFFGSAPEEVSLAGAVEVAEQAQQEPEPAATAATDSAVSDDGNNATQAAEGPGPDEEAGDAAAAVDEAVSSTDELDGTWSVDTETGEFALDEASGSFAGFRVDEELVTVGAFTAVGRTGDVSGTLEIADGQVTSAEIMVDLTTLRTDDRQRDGAVQRALRTAQHPTATFLLTEVLNIGGAVESGEPISLPATGDLTVNGITRSVVVDIEAQLVDSLIVVVGSVDITFVDFDVSVPQVPIVLAAEDHGIMEFQLLLRRR